MKAIQRAPRDRYETMAGFLAHLNDPALALEPGHAARPQTDWRARMSRRFRTALTTVVVLAVLATLVWISHRYSTGPGSTSGRIDHARSPVR